MSVYNFFEWITNKVVVDSFIILSSIGAFISALIALRTLKSIKFQNKHSLKPELFLRLSNNNVPVIKVVSVNSLFNNYSGLEIEYQNKQEEKIVNALSLFYSIDNVGNGSAISV